jgi:hypothetical protein
MQTKQVVILDKELLADAQPYLKEANLTLEEYLRKHFQNLKKPNKSKTAIKKQKNNQEKYQDFLKKLDLNELDQESLDKSIKAGQEFRKNFKLIRD